MPSSRRWILLLAGCILCLPLLPARADGHPQAGPEIFARKNLVAWCIVPFDSKRRGPEERAEMLERLGIHKLAYDYRAEHIPTFDAEMEALKKHGIELTAWWFPTALNDEARQILAVLERHGLKTQLWVTGGGEPTHSPEEQRARVKAEAERIRPIAEAAAKIGCSVGLYNHGAWFGEPENQIEIIRELNLPNVGIVYNLHHGHEHLARFPKLLKEMLPYLYSLNLNGMTEKGDAQGKKILPIGEGDLDLSLLKTIRDSGYRGPIGILNHTDHDAEARLRDNLDGLDWLLPQLEGQPAGPKPEFRTWQTPASEGGGGAAALMGGKVYDGRAEFRAPPITVECRVTLRQQEQYNILVACDEKKSADHWEIFSMAGSGFLTAYLPGRKPDHVRSQETICDQRPHTIAMLYEAARVRLFLDGRQVADQAIESLSGAGSPGGLAVGRLVEGGIVCHGEIEWVRISKGTRDIPQEPPAAVEEDDATLALWTFEKNASTGSPDDAGHLAAGHDHGHGGTALPLAALSLATVPPYDPQFVAATSSESLEHGDPQRGVAVFAAAQFACLSCHKVGRHGGSVGPELTAIGQQRTAQQIVESIFWPKREVKPEYESVVLVTVDGGVLRGYKLRSDEQTVVIRDAALGTEIELARADIEEEQPGGTLMPDGLTASMSREQQLDLVRFVMELGKGSPLSAQAVDAVLAHAHAHAPATFPYDRAPLHPEQWPNWEHRVNRDRVYDFYAKEAEFFRLLPQSPPLLPEFPGLDGGQLGHWGNQDEQAWADIRWNDTQLGSVQCGVFQGAASQGTSITVPRGVCLRLGERGELSTCFNPDMLTYEAVWQGFVKFSPVRYGFLHGLLMDGTPLPRPAGEKPDQPFVYRGYYRHGPRVVFAYRIGKVEYLDAPWVEDGHFTRTVAPAKSHPLKHLTAGGPIQWPQEIKTQVDLGAGRPYAVDTVGLPIDNPWKALVFCGDHDFLPDGSALVCTMQGDVWHGSGFAEDKPGQISSTVRWRRFASGLHHALGLVVADDGIYVQGRNQITRLRDLNGDGEADFYECFSSAFETSPAGHDFICGLQRDPAGNFYTASGNQGLLRISADGRRVDVVATGFRNPDGLGLLPDGTLTVPCSEGEWTPASMICAVRPKKQPGREKQPSLKPPFFGYRGPQDGHAPELPLAYLPRGLDNSSGGQAYVSSDRWGPLQGQLLHFSFGAGAHFLILRDEVEGQLQGAVVPLPGEFLSGAHRGRFNPQDGQLYVSGMAGWGTYTPADGCFQRVRYTGDAVRSGSSGTGSKNSVQLPVGFHVHQNGVTVTFSQPLDADLASQTQNHFAQCWNYRYSAAYGSAEFSTGHPGVRGHDPLRIAAAHVLPDGRTLFLELPDLQPVSQLHLRLHVAADAGQDLFVTVNKLDVPFTDFPGYQPIAKTILPHPILSDLALATKLVPNPWRQPIANARAITLETGKNLTFALRSFKVRRGEVVKFTLANPDVVPHNWALVKPGALRRVGELANRLVADPEAAARHYIPQTNDVLFYVDVVSPQDQFSIYFRAPDEPGRYPYLCTFPGHWMVMNGEMIVE